MFTDTKNVFIENSTLIQHTHSQLGEGDVIIKDPRRVVLKTFGEHYVSRATHDNNDIHEIPKCHPGTRVSFLSRLSDWVMDAAESSAFVTWLHGPAGGGKSAIARSLAERMRHDNLLAASFFFFRTDSNRNTEKPFVPTLAYQISCSIPDTLRYIAKTVDGDPTICSHSLQTQFEALIIKPLVYVMPSEPNALLRPMLIIVDGLDECVDRTARNLILEMVFKAFPLLHGHIKFLIVSRPEYDIQRSFDSAGHSLEQHINRIELQGDLEAYDDVRFYLWGSFDRIKQTHPFQQMVTSNWPTDDAIEQLVQKSSGHFIYASTVIKYIENDFDQPRKRLDVILQLRMTSHNPYATLDALYLNILASSRADRTLLVEILSLFVLADEFQKKNGYKWTSAMKSARLMEDSLYLEPGEVRLALLDLKSLVNVQDVIEFWHKSFSDFLLDSSRSKDFYACSANGYTAMAKACLWLLSDKAGTLRSGDQRRECHYILSICCENGAADLHLQAAMMNYEFNVVPPHPDAFSGHFKLLCTCLDNHQRASAFKITNVVETLFHQFDKYLISELRRCVPLHSEIMNALQSAFSPCCLDQRAFMLIVDKHKLIPMFIQQSCFLRFMYCEQPLAPYAGRFLYEFFHSKDRACEYYLEESATKSLSTPSQRNNPITTTTKQHQLRRRPLQLRTPQHQACQLYQHRQPGLVHQP